MKNQISITILIIFCIGIVSASIQNLDEIEARKIRNPSAVWGAEYLENISNNYYWQPETLMYTDNITGHEVWVIVHQPDGMDIFGKEHGVNAWSYDGSRLGFVSYAPGSSSQRITQIPGVRGDRSGLRFIVNTDGSKMRVADGYGKYDVASMSFGWSHSELIYYSFGSGQVGDGDVFSIYKNRIHPNNSVTGELILADTGDTYSKSLIKEGISSDDKVIVGRTSYWEGGGEIDYNRTINGTTYECAGVYRMNIEPTANLSIYWGIARECGPYLSHQEPMYEHKFHDTWSPGPSPLSVYGQYSGGSSGFYRFEFFGSDPTDGGPVWTGWDSENQTFGEIWLESDGLGTPWGITYWGHPVFDRWGRYVLHGDYEDATKGTRIWDIKNHTYVNGTGYVGSGYYDGAHHSWSGWTDHVVWEYDPLGFDVDGIRYIYGGVYNRNESNSYQICDTHMPAYDGNYNNYPRPSQSPDGTKVAFSTRWINNEQSSISYAIAYYPYPPTNLSATYNEGVNITWLPPKYTDRGWPNETIDPAPFAREIKRYHLWRASSSTGPWQIVGTINTSYYKDEYYGPRPNLDDLNHLDTVVDGTYYYALTSEEHSRLESRNLSEILEVVVSGETIISQTTVQPNGQHGFWETDPDSPSQILNYSTAVPSHTLLKWTEPDNEKIRFYNLYYSNVSNPIADRRYRIASLPVGTNRYLDWNPDPDTSGYYGITSVDRYGNEGNITYWNSTSFHAADNNEDGEIDSSEIRSYILRWREDFVSIHSLSEALGIWKQ